MLLFNENQTVVSYTPQTLEYYSHSVGTAVKHVFHGGPLIEVLNNTTNKTRNIMWAVDLHINDSDYSLHRFYGRKLYSDEYMFVNWTCSIMLKNIHGNLSTRIYIQDHRRSTAQCIRYSVEHQRPIHKIEQRYAPYAIDLDHSKHMNDHSLIDVFCKPLDVIQRLIERRTQRSNNHTSEVAHTERRFILVEQ
jgi:hypothetical protein